MVLDFFSGLPFLFILKCVNEKKPKIDNTIPMNPKRVIGTENKIDVTKTANTLRRALSAACCTTVNLLKMNVDAKLRRTKERCNSVNVFSCLFEF